MLHVHVHLTEIGGRRQWRRRRRRTRARRRFRDHAFERRSFFVMVMMLEVMMVVVTGQRVVVILRGLRVRVFGRMARVRRRTARHTRLYNVPIIIMIITTILYLDIFATGNRIQTILLFFFFPKNIYFSIFFSKIRVRIAKIGSTSDKKVVLPTYIHIYIYLSVTHIHHGYFLEHI